jgi:hypothetical protein
VVVAGPTTVQTTPEAAQGGRRGLICEADRLGVSRSGSLTFYGPGDGRAVHVFPTRRRAMSIVAILIIVILVLLAIYLFQRVF